MDLFLNHTTAKLGCPRHKRCTDGGRTFTVRTIQQWNNLNVDLKVTAYLQERSREQAMAIKLYKEFWNKMNCRIFALILNASEIREINLRFCSKTQRQMFLLVSGRQVGFRPPAITSQWKIAETWFLARLFILQLSTIAQILELIYWTIMIFSFDREICKVHNLHSLEVINHHLFVLITGENANFTVKQSWCMSKDGRKMSPMHETLSQNILD